MPKQKTPKSKQLPKITDSSRSLFIQLVTGSEDYKNSIAKGIRLFTREELDELKHQYKDGMLWDDVERELARKGILIKQATIRKYIQDGYISKPIGYRSIGRGRAALFPPDMISQINFIYYFYKVASGELIDNYLNIIKNSAESAITKVAANLTFSDDIRPSILRYIGWNDSEAYDAIENGLSDSYDDQQTALKMLEDIDNDFDKLIITKIDKLIRFLEQLKISAVSIQPSKEN